MYFRQREQYEAEEGQKDEDGDRGPDHAHSHSPSLLPPPMSPVNSTKSVVSKESPISQRKKKQ